MISGAAIPTQRAFIMTGIVFAAILIDRLRLSMRICALAALVVLLLDPASLVGVSFQMSFGAVVALIAVYETWGTRLAYLFHSGSFGRKAPGDFVAVARWVAALPGNVWSMPRLPTSGVVLVALGGCWLCLWQGKWRWWGTAGIAAGMAAMLLTRPPDLILVRGRDDRRRTPPAQIRTCGFPASGSYLGCLTAKRMLGQG